MNIISSYKLIKNCIVAFTAKYAAFDPGGPPLFPSIIGTGFVVREDGIIVTNDHVLHAFNDVPVPTNTTTWPVRCIMLKLIEQGMVEIPLEIIGAVKVSQAEGQNSPYYGSPSGPDLAFVHVKARGLPTVTLDTAQVVEEGTEVATAGFPMGTDALVAPGWIHQMTPTLQRGIISAVLPFPCPAPHAYAANIMVQGGASGSPVFLSESGAVIGVLYAGLEDMRWATLNTALPDQFPGTLPYTVPTNISYVVPAHYIRKALGDISPKIKTPNDAKTIEEMLGQAKFHNALEGRDWGVVKGKTGLTAKGSDRTYRP